jgi:hypothetical protein
MNPFSLPVMDSELYLLREKQRVVERATTAEQQLVPVHLRRPKHAYQKLEELKNLPSLSEASIQRNQRSHSYNRENIQELILRKREILLTKKKIEHKKNSISLLDSITKNNEEEHKKAAKKLEDNLLRVEKYEESLKTEAKKKAEMAERKIKERIEKQTELNVLQQEIEYVYGAVERKKEELRHLCVFKEFVEELLASREALRSSTFVTAHTEEAHTPSSLLQSINSLEKKNVFLIAQAQDAEINLENFRAKTHSEIKTLQSHNEEVKHDIRTIEKQQDLITSKLSSMINERAEEPLISPETMKLIHEALVDMFITVGGDSVALPSDFEILEHIENSIRAEIDKTKLLGEEVLRIREKEIEKNRRFKNVEALKMKEVEKAKEIAEKLERRKNKVLKKSGRMKMERSKIPEKVVEKAKVVVPQDILDRREFLEEIIPYP